MDCAGTDAHRNESRNITATNGDGKLNGKVLSFPKNDGYRAPERMAA